MQVAPPPTLQDYARVVARVGLTSFGGGVSGWMMRIVVHEKNWMTEADFLTGLSLCQVFPGINVLNLAIWLGYRLHGSRGAIAGALAMIVPPGLVIILLGAAFTGLQHEASVGVALEGVAAAAIGLGAVMGIRAARRCLDLVPAAILVATLLAIGILRWPLIPVVLVLAPLSVFLAWRRV